MQKPTLKMAGTSNGCMEALISTIPLNPLLNREGGGYSSIFFFPLYNHLKDDSNRNQRIHEGDFKEGFQKNINYRA